jgi:hypothetical protein
MPDQRAEDAKLVERIDKFAKGLSEKERNFIESCKMRVDHGRALTDPMRKWAEDIDEEKVP